MLHLVTRANECTAQRDLHALSTSDATVMSCSRLHNSLQLCESHPPQQWHQGALPGTGPYPGQKCPSQFSVPGLIRGDEGQNG